MTATDARNDNQCWFGDASNASCTSSDHAKCADKKSFLDILEKYRVQIRSCEKVVVVCPERHLPLLQRKSGMLEIKSGGKTAILFGIPVEVCYPFHDLNITDGMMAKVRALQLTRDGYQVYLIDEPPDLLKEKKK